MEREFIPYTEALALKELGFDEPCMGRFYTKPKCKMFGIDEKGRAYQIKNTPKKLYTLGSECALNENNVIIAPLYQQAFRWFREKYRLKGEVDTADMIWSKWSFKIELKGSTYILYSGLTEKIYFNSYEEAELACLKKLIEIVESKTEK